MTEIRVLSNVMVGLGFSWKSFQNGLRERPHFIGCDAGSQDPGPLPLGSGRGRGGESVRRDLDIMLQGARSLGVPFAIGSAGTAGGEPHLQTTWEIVRGIAHSRALHFRAALIHAEQNKDFLKRCLSEHRIAPHNHERELTPYDIDRSTRIVGMMCGRPFTRALDLGADVIIAGRAADPAIFAPFMVRAGIPEGIAWHAAKTIDKGNNATTDWWAGSSVMAYVRDDHFLIRPMKEGSVCTEVSVSAMTMYEHINPFEYRLSEGAIDTSACRFEQYDDKSVRVTGSRFIPSREYTILLEGAAPVGFRSIVIGGIRDPESIRNLNGILAKVPDIAQRFMRSVGVDDTKYRIKFRVYGHGAVMGALEKNREMYSDEVCLIIDVISHTQEIANTVAGKVGSLVTHAEYPGRMSPNFAYALSMGAIPMGLVYEWSVTHILRVLEEEVDQLFPVEIIEV